MEYKWEVKGTINEKQKKLLEVKKYLIEKGAKSSKTFDKEYYGTWFSYSLDKAQVTIWTYPYDALEFMTSDTDNSTSETDNHDLSYDDCKKNSNLCPACPANRKYMISIRSKENIDELVKELYKLIQ